MMKQSARLVLYTFRPPLPWSQSRRIGSLGDVHVKSPELALFLDQGVRRVLGPARIFSPLHLRPLRFTKLKATESVSCRVSSDHCYFFYNWKILNEPEGVKNIHPRADATLAKFLRKREPLWLYFRADSGAKLEKAVVRTTAEKALKKAFCIALSRYGFDHTGRRLGPSSSGEPERGRLPDPSGDTSTESELHGSILLRTRDPKGLLKEDFNGLVDGMEKLIRDLLGQLARRLPDGTIKQTRQVLIARRTQGWNPQGQGSSRARQKH